MKINQFTSYKTGKKEVERASSKKAGASRHFDACLYATNGKLKITKVTYDSTINNLPELP